MLLHHDDEQRSIRLRTPMRPKGYGDVTPSRLLPPLTDVTRIAVGAALSSLWQNPVGSRYGQTAPDSRRRGRNNALSL